MERKSEVKNKIGPTNYDLVLEDVRKGLIKHHEMKDMALKMHDHVHGIFVQHQKEDPSVIIRLMMDTWYTSFLYDSNIDGFWELKRILEDIGLNVLANKLKPNQEAVTVDTITDSPAVITSINSPAPSTSDNTHATNTNNSTAITTDNSLAIATDNSLAISNDNSPVITNDNPTNRSQSNTTNNSYINATDNSPDLSIHPLVTSEENEAVNQSNSRRRAAGYEETLSSISGWKNASCLIPTLVILVMATIGAYSINLHLVRNLQTKQEVVSTVSTVSTATTIDNSHATSTVLKSGCDTLDTDEDEDKPQRRGIIDIGGPSSSDVKWIRRCSTGNYTEHLSGLGKKVKYFGSVQVEDEVWLCGCQAGRKEGENDQSTTCQILNLMDGSWRTFAYQMGVSRIKAVMFEVVFCKNTT